MIDESEGGGSRQQDIDTQTDPLNLPMVTEGTM